MKQCSESLEGWGGMGTAIRIGLDVGDKRSRWAGLNLATGELREGMLATSEEALRANFGEGGQFTIVMEAGSHTPWIARSLNSLGHRPVVVDPAILVQGSGRKRRKNDRRDSLGLLEVARDVGRPRVKELWQRPLEYQEDLSLMRMRDTVVRARTMMATSVRGAVKPYGERIGKHEVEVLPKFARQELSERTRALVEPALELIEQATRAIDRYDAEVTEYLKRRPESKRMLQVYGVGEITVGAFMAVIGDPRRFKHSRDVADYLGLVPGQDQSGEENPQLRISKAGDALVRRLLVECAQKIMQKNSPDSALRRWALNLAGDGQSRARKKKAVISLARKLAVLLHRLWVSGEVYDPFPGLPPEAREGGAAC